jgi:hypothetical protein
MREEPRYWFPAKRYGWGWGFPNTWQGAAVFLAFVALVSAGGLWIVPRKGPLAFVAYAFILCIVLSLACWWKGEPPRWRWGEKSKD